MNPVAKRLIASYVLVMAGMTGILIGLFPMFDLFPWIRWNGVMWFGLFLGITLIVVYMIGSMLGYTGGGGTATTGGGHRQSKGARER